jgi:hypothetical protein
VCTIVWVAQGRERGPGAREVASWHRVRGLAVSPTQALCIGLSPCISCDTLLGCRLALYCCALLHSTGLCTCCAQHDSYACMPGERGCLFAVEADHLLECPAYDDLRAVCPAFPADVCNTLSSPGCVAAVMGHSAQAALANTLFHMKVRRSELLELPWV